MVTSNLVLISNLALLVSLNELSLSDSLPVPTPVNLTMYKIGLFELF